MSWAKQCVALWACDKLCGVAKNLCVCEHVGSWHISWLVPQCPHLHAGSVVAVGVVEERAPDHVCTFHKPASQLWVPSLVGGGASFKQREHNQSNLLISLHLVFLQ